MSGQNLISAEDMMRFKGRHVLITGAAAGIGRAMSIRFATAGANLTLVDRNPALLEKAATQAATHGVEVRTHTLDVAQHEQIADFWQKLEDNDLPDTLINNAGIYPSSNFTEMNPSFFERTIKVNMESALWMCQQFIKRRLAMGGIIINVASIEAILPFKSEMVPYAMSKAGVLALTRGLAHDYGSKGFRINAILPGAIRTPGTMSMVKKALSGVKLSMWRTGYDFQRRLALRRWGRPDEVATVTLFLASGLASYIQGALIPVDGGFLSS